MKVAVVSAIGCLSMYAGPALAQGSGYNTYVSPAGDDAGTCQTRAQPCKSLAFAVSKATVGGTVNCVDGGLNRSFDEVSLTWSINIDCSAAGINILGGTLNSTSIPLIKVNIASGNAADPLRRVRIRGLTLQGAHQVNGTPLRFDVGLEITAASEVYVEDSHFADFAKQGIYDHRTGGQSRLYVRNSVFTGIGGPAIVAASQGPSATVIDSVSLLNNAYGFAAASGNNVVIKNSTISGNSTAGVHGDTNSAINLLNSTLSHNTVNLNAYGRLRFKENDIQFSNVAIQGNGAISGGGNRFFGNVSPGTAPSLANGASGDVSN